MLQHKHMIVRATVENPPSAGTLGLWIKDLIQNLDMKLLSGPHVEYVTKVGNRGATGVAIIETSHVAVHVWDEQLPALLQLDVYTCGSLDPNIVTDALSVFEPITVDFLCLDREYGIMEI